MNLNCEMKCYFMFFLLATLLALSETSSHERLESVSNSPCEGDAVLPTPGSNKGSYKVARTCMEHVKTIELAVKTNYTLYQGKSQKNWEQAKRFCENHGEKLATIKNRIEQELITNFIKGKGTGVLWTAANDQKSRGTFEWVEGRNRSTMGYVNFRPGTTRRTRATTPSDTVRCVGIDSEHFLWAKMDCRYSHGFICQSVRLL